MDVTTMWSTLKQSWMQFATYGMKLTDVILVSNMHHSLHSPLGKRLFRPFAAHLCLCNVSIFVSQPALGFCSTLWFWNLRGCTLYSMLCTPCCCRDLFECVGLIQTYYTYCWRVQSVAIVCRSNIVLTAYMSLEHLRCHCEHQVLLPATFVRYTQQKL